jgi:hypothetical protein
MTVAVASTLGLNSAQVFHLAKLKGNTLEFPGVPQCAYKPSLTYTMEVMVPTKSSALVVTLFPCATQSQQV